MPFYWNTHEILEAPQGKHVTRQLRGGELLRRPLRRPGAAVGVPVPDLTRLSRTQQLNDFFGYANTAHMHFFTPATLPKYFSKYGFEVVNTYRFEIGPLTSGGFLGRIREK